MIRNGQDCSKAHFDWWYNVPHGCAKKSVAAVIFTSYSCMQWNIFSSDEVLKLVSPCGQLTVDLLQKAVNKISQ